MAERAPIDLEKQKWSLDSRLLVTLCAALVCGAWWIRDGTEQVGARIGRIEMSVERLTDELRRQSALAESSLLRREMSAWIQTQQAKGIQLTDLPPR